MSYQYSLNILLPYLHKNCRFVFYFLSCIFPFILSRLSTKTSISATILYNSGGMYSPISSFDNVLASLLSSYNGTSLDFAFSIILSAIIPVPEARILGATSSGLYCMAIACFLFSLLQPWLTFSHQS